MAVFFIAGLALSAASMAAQMQQQKAQSEYAAELARADAQSQADAGRYNAELSKQNAGEAVRVAFENRRLGRSRLSSSLAAMSANAASRGVAINSATAEDLQYEAALFGEYQLNEQFTAQFADAVGFSSQAAMQESGAQFALDRGVHEARVARTEGRNAVTATALTGATNMTMMSANYRASME